MTSPKISIIVPVYKVEQYLRCCLDSIVVQTFTDWECILIDDGSPDNSGKICDEYAEKDGRFRVIHQGNTGSSSARNVGIDVSCGEWIMMIDADDWIESETLEKCIKAAYLFSADFIKFGLFYQYASSKKKKLYPSYKEKDLFLKDLIARKVSLSIWAGMYRKSIFDNLTPVFPEGLNFGEDYSVISRLLYYSKKFHIINEALYNYRIHENGYVQSAKWSNAEQLIGCEEVVYDFFRKKGNGFYTESLLQGRADVKAYCYSLILRDYKKNKIYYDKIRPMYGKTINLDDASIDTRLLFFIMHNSFTMSTFRFLWGVRTILYNFLKTILR